MFYLKELKPFPEFQKHLARTIILSFEKVNNFIRFRELFLHTVIRETGTAVDIAVW